MRLFSSKIFLLKLLSLKYQSDAFFTIDLEVEETEVTEVVL